ncbi:hypothetical protein ETAA8_48490 [Anatilimnocola aggregata]|uniref:Uncharacterized protein n=1 Tax=Anatilimnocola aggregata TaxID=2528021 RepID=A0A517YHP9_9BACT|nr:hypothetical protein [Anatilimnocola aggregata]QDU29734.1 hypothetical protein ETAA8_48490 [Anatilimnocola aggregata]
METPEFLCWAIEQQCSLRELLPENQPDKVERHLRAARYAAEARAQNRVQSDLARSADGLLGFSIRDALAMYGGEEAVRETCGPCPANALARLRQPSYAGCFGLLPVPTASQSFYQQFNDLPADLFPRTTIAWYGLWMPSPLTLAQVECLVARFASVTASPEWSDDLSLREFAAALQTCADNQLPLSVQLYPAGQIDGPWWNLVAHCDKCRAPWQSIAGKCGMCGLARCPADGKKRRVRGTRPYRPIEQLTT